MSALVRSEHVQRTSGCPLCANSGHGAFVALTDISRKLTASLDPQCELIHTRLDTKTLSSLDVSLPNFVRKTLTSRMADQFEK